MSASTTLPLLLVVLIIITTNSKIAHGRIQQTSQEGQYNNRDQDVRVRSLLDIDTLLNFKDKYSIADDAYLHAQPIFVSSHNKDNHGYGSNNSIKVRGQTYSLDELTPVNVLGEGTTLILDGIPQDVSQQDLHLYIKKEGGSTLLISKNANDQIESISIFNTNHNNSSYNKHKNGVSNNNINIDLVRVSDGVVVAIEEQDIDLEKLNAEYRFGDHHSNGNSFPPVATTTSDTNERRRQRQRQLQHNKQTCQETGFKEMEVAIAFESSFCQALGGIQNAVNEVARIMAGVSILYQQEGLCMKVLLSHLEGFCDSTKDPYKPFVDLNSSGCGNVGLLNEFQSFWEDERQDVRRDTTHLFSGTGLECDNQGCVIGCSFVGTICTNEAYGVDYVTYTDNPTFRTLLIAHEIAHNCGAEHNSEEGYIMYPFISHSPFGFGEESLSVMKSNFDQVGGECLPIEGSITTTPNNENEDNENININDNDNDNGNNPPSNNNNLEQEEQENDNNNNNNNDGNNNNNNNNDNNNNDNENNQNTTGSNPISQLIKLYTLMFVMGILSIFGISI